MSQDEAIYNGAETFRPERFTDSDSQDVLDPYNFVFGFGRRCVNWILVNRFNTQRLYLPLGSVLECTLLIP
jgi:hypothetical protein